MHFGRCSYGCTDRGGRVKYLIAAALAVILTSCAVDAMYPAETSAPPRESELVDETADPAVSVQIIDGEMWAVIPVDGMPPAP